MSAQSQARGKPSEPLPQESALRRSWRRFRTNRAASIALVLLLGIVAVAVLAPLIAPHDPDAQNLLARFRGPGREYWFGSDEKGRDQFSRLVFASRVSLLAALEAVSVGAIIGVPGGLVAGYFGGRVDSALSWFVTVVQSFPALLLALAIVAMRGPGLGNAMFAIGIVFSPRFFRVTRASALTISGQTFIEASRSIGTPSRTIILRHVLPNMVAPLVVQLSISAGYAMLAEASLSFIGLGVQPPQASWGLMLSSAFRFINQSTAMAVFPGLAIGLSVLCLNTVGDGVRDSIGREDRA